MKILRNLNKIYYGIRRYKSDKYTEQGKEITSLSIPEISLFLLKKSCQSIHKEYRDCIINT